MKVLYFTATGNNLYVAKRIGGESYSIPKLIKNGQFEIEDEKIGIIFPTYYGKVPKIVEEFLNKAKLKSNYIFAVASYGSLSRSVISHLLEIGERNRIKFSYINDILMVDNYLPIFDMDKEMKKETKKDIEKNLELIIKDIKESREYIHKHTASIRFLERVIDKISPHQANTAFEKNFSVENTCIGCKVCEKVCPVNNIVVDEKPIFNDNCQQCLACTNNCPKNAIRLKNEKSKTRFINQNVTLKEIINANN